MAVEAAEVIPAAPEVIFKERITLLQERIAKIWFDFKWAVGKQTAHFQQKSHFTAGYFHASSVSLIRSASSTFSAGNA